MKTLNSIKLIIIFFSFFSICSVSAKEEKIFKLEPPSGDATELIKSTLEEIKNLNGEEVILELSPGDYNLHRAYATQKIYHMSNTASYEEHSDPTKHIGILLCNLRNIKIRANGAKIITHGEMTPFVIDSCENISFEGFTLMAADPSVTEIRIIEANDTSFIAETLPYTNFEVNDGVFQFVGEGWAFGDPASGLYAQAQVYLPDTDVTYRLHSSPVNGYKSVEVLEPNKIKFLFESSPNVTPGEIYQFRHWIRNEVATFINLSKNISFKDVHFNFLGNFAILSQFSENLSFTHIECAPDESSGRTNAGFADFLHFSGCKGLISVKDSYFCGAQDDGINIHGTHLEIVNQEAPNRFRIRFMHPQTFGFYPFYQGDEIEIVNSATLNSLHSGTVTAIQQLNNYDFSIEIDSPFNLNIDPEEWLVMENVTYTPEVEIIGNRFERIPTRGILLTTRRKSVIKNNIFVNMPMPAILIADDAASWYESGPVKDVIIKGNTFIDCSIPNIQVEPEIDRFEKPIHSGIKIEDNKFFSSTLENIISIKGAEGINILNNSFYSPIVSSSESSEDVGKLIKLSDSSSVIIEGNKIDSR